MKFGISFFPDGGPDRIGAQEYYTGALNLCEEADRLGFHSIRIVEHYFHEYGGYCPSPATFLAAASQRTRFARLVTGCVLPVFNHPLKLATQLAMLDNLSNGRLDVGIARAFLPHEFRAFRVDIRESRERFEEGIKALKQLWLEDCCTFKGKYHSFEQIRSLPRIKQIPHPPIWIAVTMTPESFIWAGQQGYNLMSVALLADFSALRDRLQLYRQAYRQAGHGTPSREQIMLGFPLFIAATQQQAERQAEHYLTRYLRTFADAARAWEGLEVDTYRHYKGMHEHISSLSFERILREQRALIGTTQRVAEQILQLRELFDVDYLSLQIFPCGMPYRTALEGLHLAAEVIFSQLAGSTTPTATR